MNSFKNFTLIFSLMCLLSLISLPALAQQSKVDTTIKHLMLQQFYAWSAQHPEIIDSIFAKDGIYEDVAAELETKGTEEIKTLMRGTFSAIPDFNIKLIKWFSSNDMLSCQWVMTGTQTGDFPNFPASGRSFSVRGASVALIKDGKIIRWTDYYDRYTFFSQLGAIPVQDSVDEH